MKPIFPPAMLGVLGGGQLGRYFVLAARAMGYRTAVLDPDRDAPAHAVAELSIVAGYHDTDALDRLAERCSAVTAELESLPTSSLQRLARSCAVAPGPEALAIGQDRLREKRFLYAIGLRTAPFAEVLAPGDALMLQKLPGLFPAILKTARNGYDGKGQVAVDRPELLDPAWRALGGVPCVLEKRVSLERELSVVIARGRDGACAAYPVAENRHRNGILELTVVPAQIPAALAAQALRAAECIAEALDYVGVLGVEFFVSGGELLANEYAPRPHNSGHFTLDACAASQFAQQVRALCGLRLGDAQLLSPAAMLNLLGDAWRESEPDWTRVLGASGGHLHLYGKAQPRPRRKMGHVTILKADAGAAAREAEACLRRLDPRNAGRESIAA